MEIKNIVIIGGSIIGLLNAILIKYNNICKVTVIEKRQTYTRQFTLKISKTSLISIYCQIPDKVKQILQKKQLICEKEYELKEFALSIGITIIYQTIQSYFEILYLNPTHILNCGGFNNFDKQQYDYFQQFQQVISFKMSCEQLQKTLKQQFKTHFKNYNYYININKNINNEFEIRIITTLKNKTYFQQQLQTFPYNIQNIQMFTLTVSKVSQSVQFLNNIPIIKVGDSNISLPYQRSVNVGILCSLFLATRLNNLNIYQIYCDQLFNYEKLKCNVKRGILQIMINF